MILVDSSVWIDYLRGSSNQHTERLDDLLGTELLAVGDLILAEVLQGCDEDRTFANVQRLFMSVTVVDIGGTELAIQAAKNFRALRRQGITVRKTIDCMIATRCIRDRLTLLHNDRDFDPFVEHLGLRSLL